jgi:DNA-binding transcriptional regulator YdaS (Cro superfamily)
VRGAGYESLARLLGVSTSTIRDALTGRTRYVAGVQGAVDLPTIGGPDHTTVREIRTKIQHTVKFRSEA